jgi:hypothetical protein
MNTALAVGGGFLAGAVVTDMMTDGGGFGGDGGFDGGGFD